MINPCSKCGQTFLASMTLALLQDSGCTTSADPIKCPEGGDHDFKLVTKEKVKENDSNN